MNPAAPAWPPALASSSRRRFLQRSTLAAGAVVLGMSETLAKPARLQVTDEPAALTVWSADGQDLLRYQRMPPAGTPIPSAGFFHPFATPAGTVITDLSPDDHRHHRGVFLAWVELHGAKDADFWGWGAHAPTKDRRIVNERVKLARVGGPVAQFSARNRWEAEGMTILQEELSARLRVEAPVSVLDLRYRLTPHADLNLARWAFSGFCLRLRKDGEGELHSATGKVSLPDPNHMKPESDAPDAPWYAFALKLPGGQLAGGAVINHPANPPTLWHNPRSIRMLNPCIVAPAALTWKAKEPVTLRYRVVAFDGELPATRLNALAAEWAKAK